MGETPIFDANLALAKQEVFVPDVAFKVGNHRNAAGENPASRRLLAYASMHNLSVGDTAVLFGEHFEEVKRNPKGDNHPNIRALLSHKTADRVRNVVHLNADLVSIALINQAFEDRAEINTETTGDIRDAVNEALSILDEGQARVAEPDGNGGWTVNQWLKKAVLLSFRLNDNELISYGSAGGPAFDKVTRKFDYWREDTFRDAGIRVVPGAVVRHSAYIAKGVVLMPCFVNLGAYVGEGTMVDTWATVGSCAQIGRNVHISGGAGIGGVLEPLQANPVIIEDNCFVGARSEVAEGVIVRKGAVLSMGVFIGKNTPIVDRTNNRKVIRGEVPENAVVMMGVHPDNGLICPHIVKYRDEGTDAATALNELLRD